MLALFKVFLPYLIVGGVLVGAKLTYDWRKKRQFAKEIETEINEATEEHQRKRKQRADELKAELQEKDKNLQQKLQEIDKDIQGADKESIKERLRRRAEEGVRSF